MEAEQAIQVGIKIKTKLGDNSLHSAYFVILTTFLNFLPFQTLCLAILN